MLAIRGEACVTPAGRRLSALRVARPEEWSAIVREALAGRGMRAAAAILGVGVRSLTRWARELGIKAARGGVRVGAGRPKKKEIIDTTVLAR